MTSAIEPTSGAGTGAIVNAEAQRQEEPAHQPRSNATGTAPATAASDTFAGFTVRSVTTAQTKETAAPTAPATGGFTLVASRQAAQPQTPADQAAPPPGQTAAAQQLRGPAPKPAPDRAAAFTNAITRMEQVMASPGNWRTEQEGYEEVAVILENARMEGHAAQVRSLASHARSKATVMTGNPRGAYRDAMYLYLQDAKDIDTYQDRKGRAFDVAMYRLQERLGNRPEGRFERIYRDDGVMRAMMAVFKSQGLGAAATAIDGPRAKAARHQAAWSDVWKPALEAAIVGVAEVKERQGY